jgi:hypothetical protein
MYAIAPGRPLIEPSWTQQQFLKRQVITAWLTAPIMHLGTSSPTRSSLTEDSGVAIDPVVRNRKLPDAHVEVPKPEGMTLDYNNNILLHHDLPLWEDGIVNAGHLVLMRSDCILVEVLRTPPRPRHLCIPCRDAIEASSI